jgi:hypothetical protein
MLDEPLTMVWSFYNIRRDYQCPVMSGRQSPRWKIGEGVAFMPSLNTPFTLEALHNKILKSQSSPSVILAPVLLLGRSPSDIDD